MMVKHIVMWEVTETDRADALLEAERLRILLSGLARKIPSIQLIEVGVQDDDVPRIVLYSEFSDWDALEDYRLHPEHTAVIPILRAATIKLGFVDYEV